MMSRFPGYADGMLLGVQKLQHVTGKLKQKEPVMYLKCGTATTLVKDAVTTLVFDTTANNSGCEGNS